MRDLAGGRLRGESIALVLCEPVCICRLLRVKEFTGRELRVCEM